MIDLNQVSLALRNATPRSLILLDEFGKGTAATGSCISLRLPELNLVKQPIYPLLVTSLLSVCLGVTLSRWRGPLYWSLATPAYARLRLPESNSNDAPPRAFFHRSARAPEITYNVRSYGGYAYDRSRRDHRRQFDQRRDQRRKYNLSLQVCTLGSCLGVIVDVVYCRAVNGLSLESYAARCAGLFGVPAHVVQRAQYVTYVLYRI